MSDSELGHGLALAGLTVGTVGNITAIDVSGQTRDPIDVSTMDSTDKFREFIAGLADAGEIAVTCNYDGSASGIANALNTAYQLGAAEEWTITYLVTSTFVCDGFITNLGIAATHEGIVTQTVTIKLTGKPAYTDVGA